MPAAAKSRVTPIREPVQRPELSRVASVQDEQIHALVQQLFFRHESGPVRHVGFSSVEASTETATLCLAVAKALAAGERYDVGLIDAHSDPVRLQSHLQIPSSKDRKSTRLNSSHLGISYAVF